MGITNYWILIILLAKSKYDTIEKIKVADHKELHEHLMDLNSTNGYFRGKIALNDMELIIRDANYIGTEVKIEE